MNINLFLFEDYNVYIIIAVFCVVFVLICAFLIWDIYIHFFLKKKMIKSNKEYVLEYDYKKQRITYFNKKDMNGVKMIDFDSYLRLFDEKCVVLVKEFLDDVINCKKDFNKTLICDCKRSFQENYYTFCVIEIFQVNREKNLIHMQHYFLSNLPLIHISDTKKINKIKYSFNSSDEDINGYFLNAKNSYKGASIAFEFSTEYLLYDYNYQNYIFYYFKNILATYIKKRVLVALSNNSFVLHDFSISTNIGARRLASKILKDLKTFLELNLLDSKAKVYCAVVEHKYIRKDEYNKVVKILKETLNEAKNKESELVFYDPQAKSEFFFDQSYKAAIESIIKNHSLKFKFQPVINKDSLKEIAYFGKVYPISNLFSDIGEVKQYAYRLGLIKKLFSEILKYMCSKFYNEKNVDTSNVYLLYSVKPFELECCNSLLGYIQNVRYIQLVLVFDEVEVAKTLSDKSIIEEYKKLANKGYLLGLDIKDKNLILPDEVYALFKIYIYDTNYYNKNFADVSNSSLALVKAIEKLLKYKRVMILYNIKTTSELELRLKEGMKHLSGDIIGEENEMVLPISKKSINRVKKYRGNKER